MSDMNLPENNPELETTETNEELESAPLKFSTEIKSGHFEEPRDGLLTDIDNERKDRKIPIGTFTYPIKLTYEWSTGIEPKIGPDAFAQANFHHNPQFLMEERMAEGDWTQSLSHAGKHIGAERAKYGNTGNLKGAAAVEMIRRRSGNGTTIAFPLLRSGIWLTMRPATEQELVDLDYRLTSNENAVGRSTAGMLLDAGAGSYAEALIELALSLVIDSNITNRAEGLAAALRKRIDVLDYGDLIAHMLISQYPDGYPWEFTCSNPRCNHVVTGKRINFARMIWRDKASLTEHQLTELIKRRNSISDDEIAKYKDDFKLTDKDKVTLKHANLTIHFRTTTLDDYITSSRGWIKNIENRYTTSLTKYHSEAQRAQFVSSQTQINRFAKYVHIIDKITFDDCDAEITDRATIEEAIGAIDPTTTDFEDFEEAAITYIEANTLSVFGYPSQTCNSCGVEPETPDGRFKSIVPIAPDRTFFTLAQLKTWAMTKLGEE